MPGCSVVYFWLPRVLEEKLSHSLSSDPSLIPPSLIFEFVQVYKSESRISGIILEKKCESVHEGARERMGRFETRERIVDLGDKKAFV